MPYSNRPAPRVVSIQLLAVTQTYLASSECLRVHIYALLACEQLPLQWSASDAYQLFLEVEVIVIFGTPPLRFLVLPDQPQLFLLTIGVHYYYSDYY